MNSVQWNFRAETWQARLDRLRPFLQPNTPQTNRIHNRLWRGIAHAIQMAALSGRMERGCAHDPARRICSECFAAVR